MTHETSAGGVLAKCMHAQHIGSMPKSITIRDVPDDVRDELAARAARAGQSLQEFLRTELIGLAQTPSVEEWLERVRQRKRATGSSLSATSILRHRDADRR